MTPFKEKPVKWDGDSENGRYKNKKGFKYDILTQTVVSKTEEMPKCFLADSPEEADSIYKRFERTLNHITYSYAISTNLQKTDLFGEALIGLARAYRDWDPARSDNFKSYAVFRIKDALNEFVRENSATISVPAYIKKANNNLREIERVCEGYNIDPYIIVIEQEIPDALETEDAIKCEHLVRNLLRAAERAKVDYDKFVERIQLIPEDVKFEDQTPAEISEMNNKRMEAAIVVDKLKQHMDKEELQICEGIMQDKSFEEIGREMKKSKAWVSGKLKSLRERVLSMMENGSL
jgi:RNA polymerase sigma factor (sigma-70 family)